MRRMLISLKKTEFSRGLSRAAGYRDATARKPYCKVLILGREKGVGVSC